MQMVGHFELYGYEARTVSMAVAIFEVELPSVRIVAIALMVLFDCLVTDMEMRAIALIAIVIITTTLLLLMLLV